MTTSALVLRPHFTFKCLESKEIIIHLDQLGTYGLAHTGNILWDGSFLLARLLETKFSEVVKGRKVLELGAGIAGLPSQVAAIYGAHVIATDLEEEILLLQGNMERNQQLFQGTFTTQSLDWNHIDDPSYVELFKSIDIILCADVVFGETINILPKVLATLLHYNPQAMILMSNIDRLQVRQLKRSEILKSCQFESVDVRDLVTELNLSPYQVVWKIMKITSTQS